MDVVLLVLDMTATLKKKKEKCSPQFPAPGCNFKLFTGVFLIRFAYRWACGYLL